MKGFKFYYPRLLVTRVTPKGEEETVLVRSTLAYTLSEDQATVAIAHASHKDQFRKDIGRKISTARYELGEVERAFIDDVSIYSSLITLIEDRERGHWPTSWTAARVIDPEEFQRDFGGH